MSAAKLTADPELAIWERVFVPDPRQLSTEQACYLLGVRFPQADLDRINELSAKTGTGALTLAERVELERYVHIGQLLSILKAKVLGKLKKTTSSS
jgi:hypothetical protein